MQFGYDAAHTGYNPAETTITPANVAHAGDALQRRRCPRRSTARRCISRMSRPRAARSNLLFALAKNGRLMAIDAATGAEVWHKTTTGTQPTTASPAIDPDRQYVYSYGIDG